MIQNSRQIWEIGSTVRVGFLTLRVVGKIPTPGDYAPDAYRLTSLDGRKAYEFVPHRGLHRL